MKDKFFTIVKELFNELGRAIVEEETKNFDLPAREPFSPTEWEEATTQCKGRRICFHTDPDRQILYHPAFRVGADDDACLIAPPTETDAVDEETQANTTESISDEAVFTEEEILKMPQKYQKLFRTHGVIAHIRTRKDGLYEVRCQIDGEKITGTSKLLETAKEKFIQDLKRAANRQPAGAKKNVTFLEYGSTWLETTKKPNVKPITYADYLSTFNANLFPAFGAKRLKDIRQFDLQAYFNNLVEVGKRRAAEKQLPLLRVLFECAVIDGIIPRSPMQRVQLRYREQEHGMSLSRDEEGEMIEKCLQANTRSAKAFIFMNFTGIRRAELASAQIIDDKWVKVTCAKQRLGVKEKTRLIPISPMLRKYLPIINLDEIRTLYPNRLTRTFKELCPNHHLHDLRHTFITRAQECGISRELVSLWAGHKADNTMTSNVYTHFSQEYQLQEIQRYNY